MKLLLLIPMLLALACLTFATFAAFWIVFRIASALVTFLLPGGRQRWEPRRHVREVRHVHVIEEPAPRRAGRKKEREPVERESSALPAVLGVLVLVLAVFGLTSHKPTHTRVESVAFGQAKQGKQALQPVSITKDPTWTETGTGATKAEAVKNALHKLQLEVGDHLKETMPQLEWRPAPDYLQRNLVRNVVEKEIEVKGKDDDHLGWVQQAEVTVSIAPANVQDFIRQDRDQRAASRLFLLGKVLAGLFLCFGVVGLFVRLDDYSKGYFRVWLGLGAAALVAAGVVAYFLLA